MLFFSFTWDGSRPGAPVARWGWSPLLLFLPFFLDSSFLQVVVQLLLGAWGGDEMGGWAGAQQQQEQRRARTVASGPHPPRAAPSGSTQVAASNFFWEALRGLMFTLGSYFIYRAALWIRAHGGLGAVIRALRAGRVPAATETHRGQHGRQGAAARQARWEAVAQVLRTLPTELHATEEQLQAMSVHDLKARLGAQHIDCSRFLEKRELLTQLVESGGSSATSCCVCAEDYAPGDPIRVLPCQHRFHIDCIDKWLLSATDYSRPPACPLCNAEVLQAHAGAASTGNAAAHAAG